VERVGVVDAQVAAGRGRERIDVGLVEEVQLDLSAADDQVVVDGPRRAGLDEPEPREERERLAEVAARQDGNRALGQLSPGS
jgi:hypothetical protein